MALQPEDIAVRIPPADQMQAWIESSEHITNVPRISIRTARAIGNAHLKAFLRHHVHKGEKPLLIDGFHDVLNNQVEQGSQCRPQCWEALQPHLPKFFWQPGDETSGLERSTSSPARAEAALSSSCLGSGDACHISLNIGQRASYDPMHESSQGNITYNMMLEASEVYIGLGSSIYFLTNGKDRDVVKEYLGDRGRQGHQFLSLQALQEAPFRVYVVDQVPGDLLIIPAHARYQVYNRDTRTVSVEWTMETGSLCDAVTSPSPKIPAIEAAESAGRQVQPPVAVILPPPESQAEKDAVSSAKWTSRVSVEIDDEYVETASADSTSYSQSPSPLDVQRDAQELQDRHIIPESSEYDLTDDESSMSYNPTAHSSQAYNTQSYSQGESSFSLAHRSKSMDMQKSRSEARSSTGVSSQTLLGNSECELKADGLVEPSKKRKLEHIIPLQQRSSARKRHVRSIHVDTEHDAGLAQDHRNVQSLQILRNLSRALGRSGSLIVVGQAQSTDAFSKLAESSTKIQHPTFTIDGHSSPLTSSFEAENHRPMLRRPSRLIGSPVQESLHNAKPADRATHHKIPIVIDDDDDDDEDVVPTGRHRWAKPRQPLEERNINAVVTSAETMLHLG